eukprot:gene13771-20599_t
MAAAMGEELGLLKRQHEQGLLDRDHRLCTPGASPSQWLTDEADERVWRLPEAGIPCTVIVEPHERQEYDKWLTGSVAALPERGRGEGWWAMLGRAMQQGTQGAPRAELSAAPTCRLHSIGDVELDDDIRRFVALRPGAGDSRENDPLAPRRALAALAARGAAEPEDVALVGDERCAAR